ncbi:MAG: LysR family transcriptional regulator [Candidatus Faecivicinus sp.]
MEIRYIREFLSLTETESFFETSEQMFVTTSSLSRHIKALEEEFGVPLFDRTTRRMTLNRYGRMFLPFAKELVRIDDECSAAFAEVTQDVQTTLTIGSIPMMRAYKITDLLAEFQSLHKSTSLTLCEGDSLQLIEMLRNDDCDFAFLRDNDDAQNEFNKITFATDHLVVAVPESHPLAQFEQVTVAQLRNESLFLIGKDTLMYRLCTDLCRKAGFKPKVVFTSRHADNLIDLVDRGLGIAMLMKKPAATLINSSMRLIDITPAVTTTIHLAYRPEHKMSPAANSFLELAQRINR